MNTNAMESNCPKNAGGKGRHQWIQITEKPAAIKLQCSMCRSLVTFTETKPVPRPPETKRAAVPSIPAYDSGTVPELLNKLKTCSDPRDKRRLRAALRKAGHTGGLKK